MLTSLSNLICFHLNCDKIGNENDQIFSLKSPQSNKINFLVKRWKWGGGLKMLNKQAKDKTKHFIRKFEFMATKMYRGEYVRIDMAHCYKTFR